ESLESQPLSGLVLHPARRVPSHGFKCPTRSMPQIRCRRTALRARRSRIRANADYGKALEQPTPLNVLPQPPVASLLQHNSVNCCFLDKRLPICALMSTRPKLNIPTP